MKESWLMISCALFGSIGIGLEIYWFAANQFALMIVIGFAAICREIKALSK